MGTENEFKVKVPTSEQGWARLRRDARRIARKSGLKMEQDSEVRFDFSKDLESIEKVTVRYIGDFTFPSTLLASEDPSMLNPQGKDLVKPTIHLNGTSAKQLFEEYKAAAEACFQALEACKALTVNERDYYLQRTEEGGNVFPQAVEQRNQWYNALQTVKAEIIEVLDHISDHIKPEDLNE